MKNLTEEEKLLMERYGINSTQKTFYLYKQYRYENLNDALRYAEIDSKRDSTASKTHRWQRWIRIFNHG
jgi:hypothetical protein